MERTFRGEWTVASRTSVDSFGDGLANDEDMLNYFLSSGIGEGFDELGAGSGAAGAGAGAGAQAPEAWGAAT